ncbi:major capsid protein [Sinorhizobium medicae]|uniref:major capsid protein n=1 Tax=Sinorhizobium medicae TaxID=110321 RepID=UPI002AF6B090|nr:major capsid protein [Sinorhizobium medicae]WQO60073.1 major capsid protein [Sinorhizobium medicae]
MASTKLSDVFAYDMLMATSFYERITQNTDAFNGASAGALRMLNQALTGDYEKLAFFKNMTALTRRDVTSSSAVTPIKMTMDENISVKVKRKYGPVDVDRGAFRSMGMSPDEASVLAGQAMADEVKQEMLNTAIAALDAALSGQTEVNKDVSGAGSDNKMSHTNLNAALALMGDASSQVKLWVMNGAAHHALLGNMLGGTAPQFNDSGISVYNGDVPTLRRPVLVTDCDALGPTDKYVILGLTDAGALLKVSEEAETFSQDVLGNENVITRFQGESAYNIQLKGFKWDTTSGGANPAAATVATAGNWDKNVTSHKSLAGVRLVVAR